MSQFIDPDLDKRRKQLRKHTPYKVEVLFIAEAPPAEERYFYYSESNKHDHLYINLMRAIYSDVSDVDASEIRANKDDLLKRFHDDGYLLIDVIEERIPSSMSDKDRVRLINQNEQSLINRVKKLNGNPFVFLVKHSVYYGLSREAKSQLGLLYGKPIPFPSNGHQRKFRDAVRRGLSARKFVWRDGDIELVKGS